MDEFFARWISPFSFTVAVKRYSLPANTSTILPLSPGATIVSCFLSVWILIPPPRLILLVGSSAGLLPVELRPGLDVDPGAELVDDRGDVLAALADRGGDVLVVDVDHGFGVADHLDVDKALGVAPDLALDLLLGELPPGPLLALLLRAAGGLRARLPVPAWAPGRQ